MNTMINTTGTGNVTIGENILRSNHGNVIIRDTRREDYERDLRERQRRHLDNINRMIDSYWTPCMHEQCPSCHGTGLKADGSFCIHNISCNCPKCSVRCVC